MAVVFCLIYCVNDFLIDFLRRLRSPNRLDGNEKSMSRRQLGLLEERTLVARAHNLGAPGARAPVREQPWKISVKKSKNCSPKTEP